MADAQTQAKKEMTAAEAAKMVRRPVAELVDATKDGKTVKVRRTKHVPVEAGEVLAFKDCGTHVVVVTRDGKKFSSAK
jgi:ketosteroid isomerase-like protein